MIQRRIFVISDLHLGGKVDTIDGKGQRVAGTSICSSSVGLARFFSWVTSELLTKKNEVVEIVLNGDIFDFLCELDEIIDPTKMPWYSNEGLALDLAKSLETKYFFDSGDSPLKMLRKFVRSGGRLTIMIGNHDIELSYPQVRTWLRNLLEVGRGTINFLYDGEAYSIGDVLIEHGNRYDKWNVVNHNTLRIDRSLMSRGLLLDCDRDSVFLPPAGSYMVTYIINQLKKQYRFVDLLKPETEAVIPLLITLCPASVSVIQDLLYLSSTLASRLRDARGAEKGKPNNEGYLSSQLMETFEIGQLLDELLGPSADNFEEEIKVARSQMSYGNLSWQQDILAYINRSACGFREQLRQATAFTSLLLPGNRETTLKKLHSALLTLNQGNFFAIDKDASNYFDAAKRLTSAGQFSVVIFGHTHFPKLIKWSSAIDGGKENTYINTGTWADVIPIPKNIINNDPSSSKEKLLSFANDLAINEYRKYVKKYLTFAEVFIVDNKTYSADLWQFDPNGKARNIPLIDL